MITSFDDSEYIFNAFANGADNYISKTENIDFVVNTIINVYNNTSVLRPEIAQILANKSKQVANMQKSMNEVVKAINELNIIDLFDK